MKMAMVVMGLVFGASIASAEQARVDMWLKHMDGNKDQILDRAETTGLMRKFFDRNDLNKDQKLDRSELGKLEARLKKNSGPAKKPAEMSTEKLKQSVPEGVVLEPDIAYREGSSKRWTLDLYRPEQRGDKPRPGLVFVHGGGWRSGDKRKALFSGQAMEYARKGYVCISVNYRLTDEARFPACVEDVKCAVRWFRAHAEKYNLDPDHIGGFGNSAGAHLVSMLGLVKLDAGLEGDGPYPDQSSLIQAVCAAATPTDFSLWENRIRQNGASQGLIAGPLETLKERVRKASPISYVAADAPSFLLVHGTRDMTVPIAHGDRFVEALKKAGAKDVTYLRIDGAGHGVFGQHARKTKPAMEAFFKRTLKGTE